MLNSGLSTVAAATKPIGLRVAVTVLLLVGSCLLIPRRADAECTPEPTTIVRGTVYLDASDLSAYAQGVKVIVWISSRSCRPLQIVRASFAFLT